MYEAPLFSGVPSAAGFTLENRSARLRARATVRFERGGTGTIYDGARGGRVRNGAHLPERCACKNDDSALGRVRARRKSLWPQNVRGPTVFDVCGYERV